MAADFSADKRAFVAGPALAAGVAPVVDAGHPLVEGVLLKNRTSGKQAVVLMNWAYAGRALVPRENLTVAVHGAAAAGKAVSVATGRPLSASERRGDTLVLTVPRLEDGDVLLLE